LGHYVKMPYFSNSTRIALFLIGVGFSFFWGVFLIMTI